MRPVVLFLCLGIFSCSNRTAIPKDILPQDSMQFVMKDIILASQYASSSIARDTSKKDKVKANQELMEEVFKLHHTNREIFKQSLSFYESRPDLSKKIFDSLSAYVNRHQKDLYNSKQPVKPHLPSAVHPPTPFRPHSIPPPGHKPLPAK